MDKEFLYCNECGWHGHQRDLKTMATWYGHGKIWECPKCGANLKRSNA